MHAAEKQPLNLLTSKEVPEESNRNRSLKEKITYLRENITIEPILACFVVPGVLARLATQNLNLDKACRVNLQYGDVICDALIAKESDSYQKEELAIQKLIAGLEIWRNVMYTSIPSLLILFLGAWSDRTGKRKICILMPVIGDLLMCMSNILNVYFFHEIPVQVTMFMDTFFPAITGGWIVTYMGAFSYISDISSEESRTFRVGIANLCLTAGTPVGTALSGIILKYCGYYGAFGISASLYTFSLFYGFIYIKDPVRLRNVNDDSREPKGVLNFLRTFFDPKHVKEALAIPLKKGPNNRRTKCILVFVGLLFTYGPSHGENNVKYLFVRYRFNWDAVKFSFYKTFYIGTHFVGTIISLGLFSRRLKCHDSVLGLVSNISHIFGSLAIGMARNTSEMYIGALIETFNATPFTALRSISSKLVASDELGKMTSLFNLFEILTSTSVAPLYSWLYMLTLSVNAGAVFLLSAALTIPSVAVFLWFYVDSKKKPRKEIYNDVGNLSTNSASTHKVDSRLANSIPGNVQDKTTDQILCPVSEIKTN